MKYFKVYFPADYAFPCRFKQYLDTIENVYLNFCTLIFRDNILLELQVLFLYYSECESLSEQNIFWISLPRNAQMSNAILQYFETFHWNSETDM